MVVLRLGPEVRKWAAVVVAAGLLIGVVRWGLSETAGGVAVGGSGLAQGRLAVSERAVALTFNASAADRLSPVVQALGQANLPGTFFVDPAYAQAHPDALRALVRAGDEVEVLLDGAASGMAGAARTVGTAAEAPPLFIRPTAGGTSAALSSSARHAGLAVSLPSLSAPDGAPELHPGDVILLPSGSAGAAAVAAMSKELQAGGYQAMTLEDLAAIADGAAAVSLPDNP